MDKTTVTTFTFNSCYINFFADGDLSFQDYTTADTIVLEGIDNKQLQGAIKRYFHNLAVNNRSKEWLEEIEAEVKDSLALFTAMKPDSK